MKSPLRRLLSFTALACAAAACGAGEFSVSPVRIDFAVAGRSQLLAITNTGTAPARFLVRAAGWTVNEEGAVELSDDDKLVVFPASFTVQPRFSQNVRVGTDQRPGDTEKTWRIVFEELPDPNPATAAGATINVLSVISVPVFMPPVTPRKSLKLGWSATEGRTMKLALANEGNAHELIATVTLTAMRGEQAAQQAQASGWYLLPGKRREYPVAGEKPWCELGAGRFELRATNVQGDTVATQSVDAREACR